VVEGIWPPQSPDRPRLELVLPDGRRVQPVVDHVGWTRRATFTVDGVPAGARLAAPVSVAVGRIRGFVPAPAGWAAGGPPRARVVTRQAVCAAAKPERSAQE
jgi:hypothetical protein